MESELAGLMARDILVTLLARSSPPFKLPLSELSHVPAYAPLATQFPHHEPV